MSFTRRSLFPRPPVSLRSKWTPLTSGHGRSSLLVCLDYYLDGRVTSKGLFKLEQAGNWSSSCRKKEPKLLQQRSWFVICFVTFNSVYRIEHYWLPAPSSHGVKMLLALRQMNALFIDEVLMWRFARGFMSIPWWHAELGPNQLNLFQGAAPKL